MTPIHINQITAVVVDEPMIQAMRQKDPGFADHLKKMKMHLPDDFKLSPNEQVEIYRRYCEEKTQTYIDSKLKAEFGSAASAKVRIT